MAVLTGKMKAAEKTELMQKFAEGQIDILMATTVIEVGMNVPNATVITITGADRFGFSTLHQLRGRVGAAGTRRTASYRQKRQMRNWNFSVQQRTDS